MSRTKKIGVGRVRRGWRAAITGAVAAALLLAGVTPANAVGPAVLSLEITAVNSSTGAPITSTGYNQNNNRVAYRIGYSCSVADCTNTVVTLPAVALDPTWNQFRIMNYETWTPPAGGGATIAQTPTTGVTVNLGTVPAGTSSTFVVQYQILTNTSAPNAVPASYFPPGYQIERSATISSPNATADATAAAAPVTWQIPIPTPGIVKVGPSVVRPDVETAYQIRMSSGCFVPSGSGRIVGTGQYLCAESYTVVDELPEQAQYVSSTGGGVYDAASHTVTWTLSGPGAAGGWGSTVNPTGNWATGNGYGPREVRVVYPASAFPEAADGADFIVPVTNDANVSVTYLDDAATVKTASASVTHDVARITPFGRATQTKDVPEYDASVGGRRFVDVPPDVAGLTCPPSGSDDWGRTCTPGQPLAAFATDSTVYWSVDTYNRGNVPGVATVVDNDLAATPVRVTRISTTATTPAASIAWTITNGTTTTSGTSSVSYTAPAGSWLTAATVTSGAISGPNTLPTGNAGTLFRVNYGFDLPPGGYLGDWTNRATATMTYPDYPDIDDIAVSSTNTVTFRELPKRAVTPQFGAAIVSATVAGGGQAVPGSNVTFAVRGSTAGIPADQPVSPQYVFIAPQGWQIRPDSASFPDGSVPPGVAFTYRDVVVQGVTRQAVVASWPAGNTFGSNAFWPTMSVVATPTSAVAAGTSSVASFWAGDSLNQYPATGTVWNGAVIDATDVDRDGNATEAFASTTANVVVSASDRLDVIKEICVETADGCTWVSNPDIVVGVAPDATDITYRVTLRNAGNTVLNDVVAYDVLPWVGDARGSSFGVALNEVSDASTNLGLQFSPSTNPCRAEVLPNNPGCTSGWGADEGGARAIRAAYSSPLAPGAAASVVFTANVLPGAPADAIACNSVAADTASTVPGEPRAVCATTQVADLAIDVPDRLPLQAGRPGTVPYTVTNLGGSQAAPATVEIAVPAGIRITSLAPAGWLCDAAETEADGSVLGPVTLTCDAVDALGAARSLVINTPDALNLPAVIPDESLVGDDACFPAVVSGLMFDPVEANNDDAACLAVVAGDALIGITKDDERESARIGDEITYTLEVQNLLVGETPTDVVVTDELPATLAFVSASDGGTVSGQGAPDAGGTAAGGTVTWSLGSLAPAGVPSADGDDAAGALGSVRTVTVTVRVLQVAETTDAVSNEATVSAVDPASPDEQLTDSDSDTDELIRTAALTLAKSATPTTVAAVGDDISYSFVVTNTGDVTLAGIEVTETLFAGAGAAPVVTCPAGAASLAPGASVTCTATYEVVQADLDAGSVSNTATATGTAPAGVDAPVSDPSSATVTVTALPALTLVKSVGPEAIDSAGDTVTYSFAVTNTGNVTLDGVAIDEVDFSGAGDPVVAECADGALAPGATVTCTATYEVVQADVNAGRIDNTAVAVATTPADVEVASAASSAAVVIGAAPGLTVVKSATPTDLVLGQEVTYSFVVTNTGNVTLDELEIDEVDFTGTGDLSDVTCAAGSLDPDEQVICSATYTITQGDVDEGTLSNTATATAVAPGGPITSAESTVQLPFEQAPGIALVKSADVDGIQAAGDEVEYRFRVTNTGNVTMAGVQVVEQDFTGTGELSDVTCEVTSLLPGQFVDCTATYEVTQADIDAGELSNSATATGVAPSEETLESDPSVLVLPFSGELALALAKTGTPVDVDGDDRITEADRIRWTFTVSNPSAATLTEVEVVDPMAGDITCDATTLAPGASVDCAAVDEYDITEQQAAAGRVVNVASAFALGVGDATVASAEAEAVVEVVELPTAPAGGLAATGVEVGIALIAALLIVLSGLALLIARRRRGPAGDAL